SSPEWPTVAPRLDDPRGFGQNPSSGHPDVRRTHDRSRRGPMSAARLLPLDRPDIPRLSISARLRGQLVYFMTPPRTAGLPALREDEFGFARDEVSRWLDEGVIRLVSPLDSANATEVELSDEQEVLLAWLQKNQVQHVRVEG